jgi:hypothetical protein
MEEGGRLPADGSGQGRMNRSSSEGSACRSGTSMEMEMEMERRRRSADEQRATESRNLHSFLLPSSLLLSALGDDIRICIRIRTDTAYTDTLAHRMCTLYVQPHTAGLICKCCFGEMEMVDKIRYTDIQLHTLCFQRYTRIRTCTSGGKNEQNVCDGISLMHTSVLRGQFPEHPSH